LHARAARRCGFVAFEPDSDGVMRRTRLLVQHQGCGLPQLALAVAWDLLGLRPQDIAATPSCLELRIPGRQQPLTVQLDDAGRTLVPWVPQQDWTRAFGSHVPLGMVFQVFDRRQSLRHNNEQFVLGELRDLVIELGGGQFAEDLRARLEVDDKYREARYNGDRKSAEFYAGLLPQYAPLLQAGVRALHIAVVQAVAATVAALDDSVDETLGTRLARLRQLESVLSANAEYQGEIEGLVARLRGRVGGKIGLIGYTATALADMTPIPTHERAPGVMAHANLLSGLLTGRMVRWAPTWLNVLLTLVAGLVTTLLTSRLRPRSVVPLAVLLLAACGALAAAAFYFWTYWLAATPAGGAVLASGLAVLIYRHMFLERESRQIATALSQYTSATLARQMAEDAELCKRAEAREVTAMFTDLADFTSLSERIGAERTQRLLNISLGCFADVMLQHEGMVNKFIGDGIFAFWNPVILPQPDHALRACETAVDLLIGLRALIAEQRARGGDEVFGELVLRIGVATGRAVVGPCGSEKKYDYTCVGDSVNVAARLESANKFYGTRSLVNGATRAAVGDRFVFRPLGGVRVKGKTQIVPIFELLGRTGAVSEADRRYAGRFGEAVDLFQRRQWAAAWDAVAACLRERPDDLAALKYLEAVEHFQYNPPAEDWNRALELAEK
jgi:class 3 adenylate cyclase